MFQSPEGVDTLTDGLVGTWTSGLQVFQSPEGVDTLTDRMQCGDALTRIVGFNPPKGWTPSLTHGSPVRIFVSSQVSIPRRGGHPH